MTLQYAGNAYVSSPIGVQYGSKLAAYDKAFYDKAYQAQLAAAYADAFAVLEADLDKLMARVASGEQGLSFDIREKRMRELLKRYQTTISSFEQSVLNTVHSSRQAALRQALSSTSGQIKELLGRAPTGVQVPNYFEASTWSRFNKQALNAVTSMFSTTNSPLRALMSQMGDDVMRLVRTELQRGILLGRNPLRIASRIKAGTSAIALGRARLIARTEFHRAYRMAQQKQYAQSDVLKGWVWKANLDGATCGICVAMSGTVHLSNDILDGHPGCRCVMVPLTKTWGEILGNGPGAQMGPWDVPPALSVPSGASWLLKSADWTSRARSLYGPTRYNDMVNRLGNGERLENILKSYVQSVSSPVWGPMKQFVPLHGSLLPLKSGTTAPAAAPVSAASFARDTTSMGLTYSEWFKTILPTQEAWRAAGSENIVGLKQYITSDAALMDRVASSQWAQNRFVLMRGAGAEALWQGMTSQERIAWIKGLGDADLMYAVSSISSTWRGTAADSNAEALAFQKAVADEFGLPYGSHLTNRQGWTSIDPARLELYRIIARATYNMTQEFLASRGLDYVTLARGQGYSAYPQLQGKPSGYSEELSFTLQPASSFTSDLDIAKNSFGETTIVLRAHRSNVLSMSGTGFGTGYETEWLLMGGSYRGRVYID